MSATMMENQTVSRVRPLTTVAWRKVPSNVNPKRNAAARDGALSA